MKLITSLILALVILLFPPNIPETKAQAGPAAFIIVVGLAAGALIFYAYHTDGWSVRMRTLALEEGDRAGHWTSVITNRVLVGAKLSLAFPIFRAYMTDSTGQYRLREVVVPDGWQPPPNNMVSRYQVVFYPQEAK